MSRWAVIGAGPCGIGVVARLCDLGHKVTWVDPHFAVGRMGAYYRQVPANTLNGDLLYAAKLCKSFQFEESQALRRQRQEERKVMEDLPSDQCFELGYLVDSLEDFTTALFLKVDKVQGYARRLTRSLSQTSIWTIETMDSSSIIKTEVDAIITVSGSSPCSIAGFPVVSGDQPAVSHQLPQRSVHVHSLDLMVDPATAQAVSQSCGQDDHWLVIGASHSGMLVVKNLVESGCKHVISMTRSPLRFMHVTPTGCKKYQGIGLKGPVGDWTQAMLALNDADRPFQQVWYDNQQTWEEQLEKLNVNHVIPAVGFEKDMSFEVIIDGQKMVQSDFDNYDKWIGNIDFTIDPITAQRVPVGLYGGGIAFPQNYRDEDGAVEPWVGFKRSIEQTDEMLRHFNEKIGTAVTNS